MVSYFCCFMETQKSDNYIWNKTQVKQKYSGINFNVYEFMTSILGLFKISYLSIFRVISEVKIGWE